MIPRSPEPERGFVLAVLAQGADADEELAEVEELARTAGVEPVGRLVQHRPSPAQRTYVGKGKLEELKERFAEAGAESLLVDDELDPVQQRFLEDALDARVIDRTQLILDIFAQHAVTAEGKLQVELAQLEYNLPRMRGMWQHLERLGGGVGTRGPGETQLETDRRLARRRDRAARAAAEARSSASARRAAASGGARETPTVALAGYTNVGKSTLLNALTGAEVSVDNRLFETLDPTTRGFEYEGRRYLVTDTVGFIRRLPHQLVEGFASTLEETLVADLVLHVADASAREERLDEMVARRRRRARRDRRGRAARPARSEQDRPGRRGRPAAAREPVPGRAAGLGADRGGARRAQAARRRAVRRPLGARAAARPVRPGRPSSRSCTRSARRSRSARTRRTACSLVARLPRRDLPRFAPYLVAEAARRESGLSLDRAADPAPAAGRGAPGARVRRRRRPRPRGVRARRARARASARSSRPGSPSRSPRGTPGFVQPRSGLAAKHGITIVNTPGLVDSGYRGELRVALLNTDPRETFVVEPGMRIAQLVIVPIPDVELVEVDELPQSERGVRGFGSSLR